MRLNSAFTFALMLSATLSPLAQAASVQKKAIQSKGLTRTYYLFVPDSVAKDHPAPLIVLLHGSGRDGRSLVDPWQKLAAREGIILAAPDSTNRQFWTSPQDGPMLLHDIVEEVKASYPVDERRVYLFGHSAGAGFALQMGAIESQYFAAVAIHAGALQPDNFSILDYSVRKIPFGIWVGDRDRSFPLEKVRATRDELARRNFEVKLMEMPRHDHDYYGVAHSVNEEIWTFLKTHALEAKPAFAAYANS
jgi:poly(3-hydroxybutyrate) depolymerase